MRVYLASDHAGYELKVHLVNQLASHGYDVRDLGAPEYDPEDDFPGYCIHAGTQVASDPGSLGVVIGGSGNGEQIAVNKVRGVRAALAWSVETAVLAREHNDANMVGVGARLHTLAEATAIVTAFLAAPFSGSERHARRIGQIAEYERTGAVPETPARRTAST